MTANTYSWKINHLIVKDQDSFARVVHSVNYTARATQGDHVAEHTDEVIITTGDLSQSFTAFAELSEQQVMSWVMATFSMQQLSQILGALDAQLVMKANPPLRISGDLPWMPTTGSVDIPLTYTAPPELDAGYTGDIPTPLHVTTGTDFPPLNIPVR
jgi:hypothetical protein